MTVKESLPETTKLWFVNANDGTVEGLYDETLSVRSVSYVRFGSRYSFSW